MEAKATDTEAQDQHVYNQFPNENEIVHEQNIIAILKERTGLRDEEILYSLRRRLIEKSKFLHFHARSQTKHSIERIHLHNSMRFLLAFYHLFYLLFFPFFQIVY